MKSQRDAFFEALYDIAFHDKDVVLISADMGAPSLDRFRKDLAQQYVDVGIAEQQAISLAAGLTLGGKKAYTYAIAPFITLRCFEQVRVNVAAAGLPVTLVGVGAGMSYAESGPTHHTVEDLSCLRTLPHMRIFNCTDSVMSAAMASLSRKLEQPSYVRLDRQALPNIYKPGADFSSGLSVLEPGQDVFLVSTGNMTHNALAAREILKGSGISPGIIDVYSLPVPQDRLCDTIRDAKLIFTIEEHSLAGGFGSAVIEVLVDNGLTPAVKRLGCDLSSGYCYKYGGRAALQRLYGLDPESIAAAVSKAVAGTG